MVRYGRVRTAPSMIRFFAGGGAGVFESCWHTAVFELLRGKKLVDPMVANSIDDECATGGLERVFPLFFSQLFTKNILHSRRKKQRTTLNMYKVHTSTRVLKNR